MSRDADPFVGRCARCSKPKRLFRSVLAPASASTPRATQSTVALVRPLVACARTSRALLRIELDRLALLRVRARRIFRRAAAVAIAAPLLRLPGKGLRLEAGEPRRRRVDPIVAGRVEDVSMR